VKDQIQTRLDEFSVVVFSYAIVKPEAVVIELIAAPIAHSAVLSIFLDE
jgi:hypothetical protein